MFVLEDNQKQVLLVAVGKADWMEIPFGQHESRSQRAELNSAQSIWMDKMST